MYLLSKRERGSKHARNGMVSFTKLFKGGNWRNLDFEGGMMVKEVTKFHKRHLGRGWSLLECVCVQDIIQDFEFWEGGNSQSLVDVERM